LAASRNLQNAKDRFIEAKTYQNTSNSVSTSAWLRYASNMKRDKCHFNFAISPNAKLKEKNVREHSILCLPDLKK